MVPGLGGSVQAGWVMVPQGIAPGCGFSLPLAALLGP